MKRIVITEEQLRRIEEGTIKERVVKKIVKELNKKYEPSEKTFEGRSGPQTKPLLRKKFDGEEYHPKDVFKEFNQKHEELSEEFIKQVIKDWYNGDLDENYNLTKSVTMTNS